MSNSESTKVMIRPPLGDFDVELRLTEKTLKLFVNGREENSETSLGLFTRPLKAGIEVGQDTPPTLIEGDGPFSFSGKIENVIVQIGP